MVEANKPDDALAYRSLTEAQRSAVVEELHRVLDHPALKSSKQCVTLLRFLVDHILDSDAPALKERTLGVEVFGRNPDYDTNADPIVRRTANEIRKRLAQCYQETDGGYSVKIHLARGHYLPEFEFVSPDSSPKPLAAIPSIQAPEPFPPGVLDEARIDRQRQRRNGPWIVGIAAILLILAGWLIIPSLIQLRSPEYRVWKPLLSSNQIMVCLSDAASQVEGSTGKGDSETITAIIASPQTPPDSGFQTVPPSVPYIDAHVSHAITTRILDFKRRSILQTSSALKLQDFRQQPAVLIGGANNPWSLMLLSRLRYSIKVDPATNDKWIQDSMNPSKRDWKIDGKLPNYAAAPYDYAVVTRYFDDSTGQWIIALSGLEAYGTEAAGELVADPAFAKYIPADIRSSGNFQIVLRTAVLRGNTGPIDVLASYNW